MKALVRYHGLKEAMKTRGLSIERLSNICNLSVRTINYARNSGMIRQHIFETIATGIATWDRDFADKPKSINEMTQEQRDALDRAQREFDIAVDAKYAIKMDCKVYTREEINAIQHKMTPLHLISKVAFQPEYRMTEDIKPLKMHRRFENTQVLYAD